MYIRDCGYGRSRRSRARMWPVIGMCILALGMGGVTIRVMAAQEQTASGVPVVEHLVPGEMNIGTNPGMGSEADTALTKQDGMEQEESLPEVKRTGNPLIVIDPGHGGEDDGCSRGDVEEKQINLEISLALREKLERMGYDVLLTREDDTSLELEERVEIANCVGADIYISIHQNASEETSPSGIETWYNMTNGNGEDSKRLARLIHDDLILYTDARDRGLVEDESLHVIRETKMPSCLLETGFLSNPEDRQMLLDEEYQSKIVEGIASGIDLYFHPKTMYLTFDDGPSPENTEKILDILKERNIKATFFVIGENVRKNPETARRIVEEGHSIGIHCNWHEYESLYKDVDSYVADFEQAYQMVYEVTGVEAKMFRFPGGSINAYNKKVYKSIIEEMTDRGFVYYDWNASLEDAVTKGSPEQLIQNAEDSTLGRKKVIMLAHDTVGNTALCLEELIEAFPEYKMEPLTADVEPIQF